MRISDWSSDVCFSDLKEAVDPGQLLLEHLGDAVLDRFGRRAGIGGADIDLRRRDIGILLDRQRKERADAAEHDDDRQHPGKDWTVDEKKRHAGLSALRPGRSEERRVGEESVSTGRSRCAPYKYKKKNNNNKNK